MKLMLLCFCVAILVPWAVMAGGSANSYRLDCGAVAVTNTQANSSWVPVAVLVKFDAPATGSAAVLRISQGVTYTLGICSFAGASNVVWVSDCAYPFGCGDVLLVSCTATNGTVQILVRGE